MSDRDSDFTKRIDNDERPARGQGTTASDTPATLPPVASGVYGDWLDALLILKRAGLNVRALVEEVRFAEQTTRSYAFVAASPGLIVLRDMGSLAKIERVEILTTLAIGLSGVSDNSKASLLRVLSCCNRPALYDIPTRWRSISYYLGAETSPLAVFEDRPTCRVCHGRIATGAAWTHAETGATRPDIHEECYRFGHRLLAQLAK